MLVTFSAWLTVLYTGEESGELCKQNYNTESFQGGIYIFDIIDSYCSGYCVFTLALTECIVVSYVYGKEPRPRMISNNVDLPH